MITRVWPRLAGYARWKVKTDPISCDFRSILATKLASQHLNRSRMISSDMLAWLCSPKPPISFGHAISANHGKFPQNRVGFHWARVRLGALFVGPFLVLVSCSQKFAQVQCLANWFAQRTPVWSCLARSRTWLSLIAHANPAPTEPWPSPIPSDVLMSQNDTSAVFLILWAVFA